MKMFVALFCIAVVLLHSGELETAALQRPCAANKLFFPVCASNGQTYNNRDLLKCASNLDPAVQYVRDGSC
ncbi:hypothetical protein CHUAL_007667 [Chamberlinius hualienensis]